MKYQVRSIEKSQNWGEEDARGNVRFFAVVRFTKASNKFSAVAVGSNSDYPLSYDLESLYKDDEDCQDKSGDFDADKAFKQFCKDAKTEDIQEGLNLFEIALPFAVKVADRDDAQPFASQRQAFYGSEKEAREYVEASLKRDLARGRLVKVEEGEGEG